MLRVRVPAKVVFLGEHAVQWGGTALAASVDLYTTLEAVYDPRAGGIVLDSGQAGHAPLLRAAALGLQAWGLLPPGPAPLAPGGACTYRVRVEEEAPRGVGLGTSSSLTVGFVALLAALRGAPLPPADLFLAAACVERATAGASGLDAAACVFGPVRFSLGGGLGPPPDLPEASLIFTGRPHAAAARKAMAPETLQAFEALVPPPGAADEAARVAAALPQAHRLLVGPLGLGFPEASEVVRCVARAKLTGKGGGGCLLAAPPLTEAEVGRLAAAGYRTRPLRPGGETRVEDTRYFGAAPPPPLAQAPLAPLRAGKRGQGAAPSNLALVKYWGKDEGQVPHNPSLSLSLRHCRTVTELWVTAAPPSAAHPEPPPRARDLIGAAAAGALPSGLRIACRSRSNFPAACGAASSAAGFAALARALARLLEVPDAWRGYWVEQWARLGSGSAVRSLHPGVVVWDGGHARPLPAHPRVAQLEHVLVVHDPAPKEQSSAAGHAAAPSSPFHELRVAAAAEKVWAAAGCLQWGDLVGAGRLAEAEALGFLAVAATAAPPHEYLTADARRTLAAFFRLRAAGGCSPEAFFSVDAGPNLHFLAPPEALAAVLAFARRQKCAYVLHRRLRTPWYRAHVVSGKRFSGKTTLVSRWAAEAGGGVQVAHLSDAIKRDYWEAGLAGGLSYEAFAGTREGREPHRAALTAFARERLAARGEHYWLRRLWAGLPPAPRTLLVGDIRRPADLAFFRECADCTAYRLDCPDAVRAARGWVADPAIDGGDGETGLDGAEFDHRLGPEAGAFAPYDTRRR